MAGGSGEERHPAHPEVDGPQAPWPLRWVEELVNTRAVEAGTDDLASASALGPWLADRGLLAAGTETTEVDRERAVRLREGLRALLVANAGPDDAAEPAADAAEPASGAAAEAVIPGALGELGALASTLPLVLDVSGPEPVLAPSRPGTVDGALASLLAGVAAAAAAGTWARLKVCREPACRWAYYDHSRNRSRSWCSMASCGNRAKARAFRRRAR